MKVPYLDLRSENAAMKNELVAAFSKVIESSHFILGEHVEKFERRLAEKYGFRHVVAVNSGTDALILALKALNVGAGDEVITVSNSFFATANAIRLVGATPIFVDVGEDQLIDCEIISEAITSRTRAILPVHLTGKPAKMDAIIALADKHDLAIVEDCAQAVGAMFKERSVGTFGLGAFSLHPLKNLSACGDGGFITTADDAVARKLRQLRNHGLVDRDHLEDVGFNSRLDEVQAAVLNVKLSLLDELTRRRRSFAKIYAQKLETSLGRGILSLPSESTSEFSVYHTYVIRCETRERLQKYLSANGIETKIHYPNPIHLQKPYQPNAFHLPRTEKFSREILSLPIHQSLCDEQITYVTEKISEFYRG
jgi:dTDP-4-amino-4,6-dideoxygalactose transaminase